MRRILEDGGFQGMVRFTKDHNVCDKCESNFVGSSEAESRYKGALEAEDTVAATHWQGKLRDINQYQLDHMALHVSMHKFINNLTDLSRTLRLDLMSSVSCIEIVGEVSPRLLLLRSYSDAQDQPPPPRANYDPAKSYELSSLGLILMIHADAAASRPGYESFRSTTGAKVMSELSLEGVGNFSVFEATLYSMLDGAGSETCDHIIMSLLTYLFQQLNGEMVIIFIFDGVFTCSLFDEEAGLFTF
jgi:hypothetical protein